MTARSERRPTPTKRRGFVVRTAGALLAAVGLLVVYAGVTADSLALVLLGFGCVAVGIGLARAPWYVEEGIAVLVRLFV